MKNLITAQTCNSTGKALDLFVLLSNLSSTRWQIQMTVSGKNNIQKFGRCGDSNLFTNIFIFHQVQPLIHLYTTINPIHSSDTISQRLHFSYPPRRIRTKVENFQVIKMSKLLLWFWKNETWSIHKQTSPSYLQWLCQTTIKRTSWSIKKKF